MANYYDRSDVYELPKLDMKLWGKIEAVDESEPGRARFKAMHDFAKACLPAEYLEAKLDGKTLETIDLNKLSICVMAIRAAYNREVSEAQDEANANDIERIREISDAVKGVVDASKLIKR